MTCLGTLDGRQLAGKPGPFIYDYSYGSSDVPLGGNTCALSGGHGHWRVTLPTSDGDSMALTGPFAFLFAGAGVVQGRFGRHPATMVQEFYFPSDHVFDQNCVTSPVYTGEVFGPIVIQ